MKQNNKDTGKGLARISLITLIAVYVLILVGGIVRSTGSGMGCPDWPKCFGSWVPPTSVEQLPDNFQDKYTAERMEKNIKFARYLTWLGMEKEADAMLSDDAILHETPFNVYRTWTEYINRVVGATIGFLMILTVIAARHYWKSQKHLFVLAFLALVLTIFQGWLGSIVVSTNLLPWMVTVHMIPALVIVAMLIYLVVKSKNTSEVLIFTTQNRIGNLLIGLCLTLVLVQIILGTQVREAIDLIADQMGEANRGDWVSNLGIQFLVHRSFSWAIAVSHVALIYWLIKNNASAEVKRISLTIGAVVLANVLTGIIMAYFGMPAYTQPIHLLLGIVLFGLQVYLFFKLNMKRQTNALA